MPARGRIHPRRSHVPRAVRTFVESLENRTLMAFGLTTTTSSYVLDTGAKSVFTIAKSKGELTSIKYNGAELMAPFSATQRYSHYESGLSPNAVLTPTVDPAGQWVKITCDDSAANGIGVTHHYVIRKGSDALYMASLPVPGRLGEGRFITYLDRTKFTNIEEPSNISANDTTIEGSDVFAISATGQTRSKYYNTRRMIENEYHGVTGSANNARVGAWMNMGNREHSAGGPFFKDIDFQTTGGAVELYNCVFTGHTQTETLRDGLQGPYALQFTDGSAPPAVDYAFMETVGIAGLTPASARGTLTGKATLAVAGHESTVALSSAQGQYWATPDRVSGTYAIRGIEPGTYLETLYQNELAVGTRTVTIAAGQTTRADIVDTYNRPAALWAIGEWDGTPIGFLNADKIETMHPSDVRMSSWVRPTFTVGVDADHAWPMTQFKDVNNATQIRFDLTAAQAASPLTLRVGITLAFAGARPRVTVNGAQPYAWTSAIPNASVQPDSRGITRGTWRGNNFTHAFDIPASALRAGTNTIDLPAVSGQTTTGFLSPSLTYDAIDLVPTASLTNAPRVASLAINAAGFTIGSNGKRMYAAVARDQFGNVVNANLDWSTTNGQIDATGLFTAPASGTATITARSGTLTTSTTVTVSSVVPSIIVPATASANPVYANGVSSSVALSVLGSDDAGEANLTYTWSVVDSPPAPVTFSTNGTNAAKSTVATFTALGTYTIQATLTDAQGRSTTSQTSVIVRDARVIYSADAIAGDDLTDVASNNRDATLAGSYQSIAGVRGNALRLNGGYATLPNGIASDLTDFTVGAWVKIDAQNTWARLFDFGSNNTASMFLAARTFPTGGIRFSITTNGAVGEQSVDGPALVTGVWTHVAVSLAGSVATLYVNGVAVGTNANVTLRPADLGFTTHNFIGKSQYDADPALAGSVDDFRLYGRALSTGEIEALADVVAPTVSNATFEFETAQRVVVTFSEDVLTSLDAADLVVTNRATGASLPMTAFAFDKQRLANGTTRATWTHLGAGGALADGDYRVSIIATGVADAAGNVLTTVEAFDFAVLAGDADRDRDVDFDDLLTLASAFGTSGRTFSGGNFDYSADGSVNFDDLLILASRFGTSLPSVVAPFAAAVVAPRTRRGVAAADVLA